MKKKTLTLSALALAMNCFAQVDTIPNGSIKNPDFYTNVIIDPTVDSRDVVFEIAGNEILRLELSHYDYETMRSITVYYVDGTSEIFLKGNNTIALRFYGNKVKKVVINKL